MVSYLEYLKSARGTQTGGVLMYTLELLGVNTMKGGESPLPSNGQLCQ